MKKEIFCPNCYFKGSSKGTIKGSFGVEIILWMFLIIPGFLYTLWRHTTKGKCCPECGNQNIIPADSERAKKLAEAV